MKDKGKFILCTSLAILLTIFGLGENIEQRSKEETLPATARRFLAALARSEPVEDKSGSVADIAGAKMRLRSIYGIDEYLSDALLLAMANEYEYLEYCWLKARDPAKRLVIAAVVGCETRIDTEILAEYKEEAARYTERERVARLRELTWIAANKVQLAAKLARLLPDRHEMKQAYLKTARKGDPATSQQ
jgi:hypothetical protein